MNKLFANIFAALVIVGIIIFVVITGWKNYTAGYLTDLVIPFFMDKPITTTTTAVILLSFVLGGIIGAVYALKVNVDCNSDINFYRNKLSRIAQSNDSDSALIDSLQRKISSLEIALENALKDKNN